VKNQRILVTLAHNVLQKRDIRKYKCGHLCDKLLPRTLPSEVQKVIFQLYSAANSINQLHVIFHGILHLRLRSCILLTYVIVSVQSDLILPELHQHLFQMNCIRCVWVRYTLLFLFVHFEHSL